MLLMANAPQYIGTCSIYSFFVTDTGCHMIRVNYISSPLLKTHSTLLSSFTHTHTHTSRVSVFLRSPVVRFHAEAPRFYLSSHCHHPTADTHTHADLEGVSKTLLFWGGFLLIGTPLQISFQDKTSSLFSKTMIKINTSASITGQSRMYRLRVKQTAFAWPA